jgi:hypothetical protein
MSNQVTSTGSAPKKKLQIVGQAPAMDIEQELAAFEEAEKKRLGLDGKTEQWIEDMVGLTFTKAERKNVTVLVGGLTIAHDYLVEGALKGVGYNVAMLDVPDTAAFQVGKEFGNRGQCNPTYFTVGNLVKTLQTLRDKHGLSSEEVVKKFVFLTAGACGPCRFGMYVTEYRKALRDAGFEGFRVLLFQQTGGVKQATGDELGLELGPAFFWAIIKAIFAGDVLNALGYRMRPYEVKAGETDKALEASKKIIYEALEKQTMILPAIWRCKPLFEAVELDRTMPKPKISIIGEFWAMTTEGDGNYGLQRFLEQEGAEADIQLVAAWILYMIWEGKHDTLDRKDLREHDFAKYGLGDIGNYGATVKLAALKGADLGVRALFQTFAYTLGLYGYHLPDMDKIADVSDQYYSNDLRGGEEGAHDPECEALWLHAQRWRVRRRAERHQREVPRDDLLPRGDQRRWSRQLLLPRADVPVQGEAVRGGRVRPRAFRARGHQRAGASVLEREPQVQEPPLQGTARLRRQLRRLGCRGGAVHHQDPRAALEGARGSAR